MPKPVLIDTDPGVDDALALILAFRSPELSVEAITTVAGNVPVHQATRNVFTLLDLLKPTPRPLVGQGAERPLQKAPMTATHVHGDDGLGDLSRFKNPDGTPRYPEPLVPADLPDAKSVILETIERFPGELTIIALGPLTNLATAILGARQTMRKVHEVVIMGGAIAVPGNVTPAAEFNIASDPHAARLVFAAGLPVRLIPLDVTRQVRLTRAHLQEKIYPLKEPVAQFVGDCTAKPLLLARELEGEEVVILHDPLAVGAAIDPSLVRSRALSVQVETSGEFTEGMTLADLRPIRDDRKKAPNLRAAMEVEAERFLTLFLERVCRRSS